MRSGILQAMWLALALTASLKASGVTPVVAENCVDTTLFDANPMGRPPHLRWPIGATIAAGCSNCTTEQNDLISDARIEWNNAVDATQFTLSVGSNISWKSDSWGFAHDLGVRIIDLGPTPDTPYLRQVSIKLDGTRTDWWYGDCDPASSKYDFRSVVTHELGHLLGLKHPATACSNAIVMHETLNNGTCRRFLSDTDKSAITKLYACSPEQRLAVSSGMIPTSGECRSGSPDVALAGFRVVDGIAVWCSVFEDGTLEYLLEASVSKNGPWIQAVREPAGTGEHVVSLAAPSGEFVRLVEVDAAGARIVREVVRAWSSAELFAVRASVRRSEPMAPEVSGPHVMTSSCTAWAENPDYVIFTVSSLYETVDCTVGALRESQGHAVRVIDVDASAQGNVTDFIRTTIQSYHSTFGTKYFHIIGTWEDELSSPLWEAGDYWLAKQAAYRQYRDRREMPPSVGGATIPPVITRADGVAPTAASTPYVYSDQPYGDVDADGVPDVAVTRWPFSTTGQVLAAYHKLEDYHLFSAPKKTLFLGYDVQEYGWTGDLVRFAVGDEIQRLIDTGAAQAPSRFFYRDGGVGPLTVETADSINAIRPDVMFLLGSRSNSYRPAEWFDKSYPVPWEMSFLWPSYYARLIVAASCDAADYEDFTEAYGAPSCVDFLAEPDGGAMEWIGSTGATLQAGNHLVTARLIEEMYANPYRPMAESWLVAMQRAYADVAVSSVFDELLPTLQSYVFLGDPLAPLAPLPARSIVAYARKMPSGTMLEMPAAFAVACPQRDADQVVVEVKLNAAQVVGGIDAVDLVLGQPTNVDLAFFPDGQEITADSAAVLFPPATGFPNGYYKTTFTVTSIGGCGVDSTLVSLEGMPLGYAKINVRSPDILIDPALGATRAKVTTADFAEFGAHNPATVCDCVETKLYSKCADYVAPDTSSTPGDFAFFGTHYLHGDPAGGGNPTPAQLALSSGTVRLEFAETQPLAGEHLLKADVVLEGVGAFTAAVVALADENSSLQYIDWTPDPSFQGQTMCTDLERDGQKQVFLGVLGSKNASAGVAHLGTATFRVASDDPVTLTEQDFALITADILEVGGQVRQVSPSNRKATFAAPSYHDELAQNYPNPFNPTTTIAFSLAKAADAQLRIYDVRGAAVRTLVNGRRQAGVHRVDWDGHNDRGQPVSSGVYFYKLVAGSFTDTKKMTILK